VAAREALHHVGIADNEYVALRSFGGPCTASLGPPQLPFTRNGREKLDRALAEVEPSGKGNLANAVIAAIGDFADTTRFTGRPRVVVVTGSNDECTSGPIEAITEYQHRHSEIEVDFRFIGVHLTDPEKQALDSVRAETKGKVLYVDGRDEILRGLETFLVWEPLAGTLKSMLALLNDCNLRLNAVLADLKEPGLGAAEPDFRSARATCTRADQPFRDLDDKERQALGPGFAKLSARVGENRDMRERIIVALEKLIANARSGDIAGYDIELREFNAVEDTYNRQVADLNEMLRQVQSRQ
jgi:hypothetical protein